MNSAAEHEVGRACDDCHTDLGRDISRSNGALSITASGRPYLKARDWLGRDVSVCLLLKHAKNPGFFDVEQAEWDSKPGNSGPAEELGGLFDIGSSRMARNRSIFITLVPQGGLLCVCSMISIKNNDYLRQFAGRPRYSNMGYSLRWPRKSLAGLLTSHRDVEHDACVSVPVRRECETSVGVYSGERSKRDCSVGMQTPYLVWWRGRKKGNRGVEAEGRG